MQTLREKKTTLTEILSADISFVLQHVQEKQLITDRDYKNLNVPSHSTEEISIKLLDILRNKDEETCQKFISLLKEPLIVNQFPRLKDLFPTQPAAPGQGNNSGSIAGASSPPQPAPQISITAQSGGSVYAPPITGSTFHGPVNFTFNSP